MLLPTVGCDRSQVEYTFEHIDLIKDCLNEKKSESRFVIVLLIVSVALINNTVRLEWQTVFLSHNEAGGCNQLVFRKPYLLSGMLNRLFASYFAANTHRYGLLHNDWIWFYRFSNPITLFWFHSHSNRQGSYFTTVSSYFAVADTWKWKRMTCIMCRYSNKRYKIRQKINERY